MKQKYNRDINSYIDNNSHVKLYYFEDEIYGQIIMNSKDFIVIKDIKDWHYNGYMIFLKKSILKIKYGKLEKFREKIIKNKFFSKNIEPEKWLNITSFKSIFTSLKNNFNQICIEGASEDVNQFMIGKIKNFDSKGVYINKLTTYADLDEEETYVPNINITCIYFNDEYSLDLFLYYEKHRKNK